MAANIAGMMFMPYYRHIMTLLDTDPRLKSAAKGIFKQVCYAAVGTAVGGVVGGPLGALVGGGVGSLFGYRNVHDYDSMLVVLRDMSDCDRDLLVQRVQELVGSTSIEALTTFIGQQVNRETFLHVIREFSKNVSSGA